MYKMSEVNRGRIFATNYAPNYTQVYTELSRVMQKQAVRFFLSSYQRKARLAGTMPTELHLALRRL